MGGPSLFGMVQPLPPSSFSHMGMRSQDLHGNMHAVSVSGTAPLLRQRSQAANPACRGACSAMKSTICSQRPECSVWQRAAGQRSCTVRRATAGNADAGAMSGFFNMLGQMMQQGQASEATPSGAALGVNGVSYHPPGACRHMCEWVPALESLLEGTDRDLLLCFAGTPAPLLNDISMQLPANSMGLVYGSSGSVRGRDWQIRCSAYKFLLLHADSAHPLSRQSAWSEPKCAAVIMYRARRPC
jgi:hypothetical protein